VVKYLTRIGRSYTSCIRDTRTPLCIEQDYYVAIDPIAKLEEFAEHLKQKWMKGINACRRMYSLA